MKLLILAAGMGSRFGGLKQMEPMDKYNHFIIDFSVYDAIEAGFDSVVFVITKAIYEDFKSTVGKRFEGKIKTTYCFQDLNDLPEGFTCPKDRVKPWGTGHAILAARDYLDEDFIMINADDYYGKETYKVAADYLKTLKKEDVGKYANVAFNTASTLTENGSVKRGVCFTDENGYLEKLVESSIQKDSNGVINCTPLDESLDPFTVEATQPVSMNLFAFTPDIIGHLKERFVYFLNENINNLKAEYLIPDIVSQLSAEGKATLKILSTPSIWYGVTYKEDKPNVVKAIEELTKEGKYPENF